MREPHLIGIWGATSCGKSTYLTALQPEFNRRQSKDKEFGWTLRPTNDASEDYINRQVGLFSQGEFPHATDIGAPDLLEFDLKHPTAGQHRLRMMDAAGGLIDDEYDEGGYFKLLAQSAGILLMFDCTRTNRADRELTGQRVRLLADRLAKSSNPIPIILAFCITKIDQHPNWQEIAASPCAFLKDELIGDMSYRKLRSVCPNRFPTDLEDVSAVSVVGRYRPQLGLEKWNFAAKPTPHIVVPRHWEPYRLLRPLFYLLRHLN